MSGKLKISLLLLAIVIAAVFWLSGNTNTTPTTASIETAAINTGNITRAVTTSGSVRPLITVEVGSQVSGQIKEILVDFNSEVSEDQLLAIIDPQSFESRVLQNTADFQVANSNVIVQQANIDRAKANLRRARLEYERAEPLSSKGTLSISELDAALAAFDSAKADLTMAEAQLENALATRDQRQASLKSVEIDLERTKIRSPIDGVVIERAVDQGQTVAASLSSPVLFYIAQDLTEIQIEANVDEADIGNVSEGNEVTFSVDAFPDSEFTGAVNQVRLAPNEANNVVTYTVIITAHNPGRKLLPGMTAIVEIVTGRSENVLRVSNDAIRFKPAADSELAKKVGAKNDGAHGGKPRGGQKMDQAQFKQYQHIRKQASETRSGQLWVQSEDGEINPVPVRFGISDDNYTQVFGKNIEEGTVVITRIRNVRK